MNNREMVERLRLMAFEADTEDESNFLHSVTDEIERLIGALGEITDEYESLVDKYESLLD